MKTLLWILIGIAVGLVSWVPVSLADRYTIPFFEVIIAFAGTFAGGAIVLVAAVKCVRYGSATR